MIMLAYQMGTVMENSRDIHWYILLVQYMELRVVLLMVDPPMAYQVGTEIASLRPLDWEHQ